MDTIYEVTGNLPHGFVGQISYTICLEQEYDELDICFSFDKQHYEEITKEAKEEVIKECKNRYNITVFTQEQLLDAMSNMKTEIHTIATMNDQFIGGIHRQEKIRHMCFSKESASDGCIPQEKISGVIKVTIIVFNVLLDHTNYTLSLSAGKKDIA